MLASTVETALTTHGQYHKRKREITQLSHVVFVIKEKNV